MKNCHTLCTTDSFGRYLCSVNIPVCYLDITIPFPQIAYLSRVCEVVPSTLARWWLSLHTFFSVFQVRTSNGKATNLFWVNENCCWFLGLRRIYRQSLGKGYFPVFIEVHPFQNVAIIKTWKTFVKYSRREKEALESLHHWFWYSFP